MQWFGFIHYSFVAHVFLQCTSDLLSPSDAVSMKGNGRKNSRGWFALEANILMYNIVILMGLHACSVSEILALLGAFCEASHTRNDQRCLLGQNYCLGPSPRWICRKTNWTVGQLSSSQPSTSLPCPWPRPYDFQLALHSNSWVHEVCLY